MWPVRGNVIRGIRATWYLMDGADIVSKHETRRAAEDACEALREVLADERKRAKHAASRVSHRRRVSVLGN